MQYSRQSPCFATVGNKTFRKCAILQIWQLTLSHLKTFCGSDTIFNVNLRKCGQSSSDLFLEYLFGNRRLKSVQGCSWSCGQNSFCQIFRPSIDQSQQPYKRQIQIQRQRQMQRRRQLAAIIGCHQLYSAVISWKHLASGSKNEHQQSSALVN